MLSPKHSPFLKSRNLKQKPDPNDVIDTEDGEVLLLIKCSQIPILSQSACVAANIIIVNPQ